MTSIFTIETYAFTLQIFEISICYLMMILSFILIDKIIYENKWYLAILVIPILGFTFNAYQSFYILFITLSCIFFIININSDNSVKSILKYILIFILAFIFSFLFLKIFTNVNGINNDNGYILEQINYKNDLKKGILYLGATLIYSTFGRHVINISFFAAGLLLLLFFRKNKDKMYIIASSILLISPFLLSLVFENYTFFRSQLSIPLIISFVFVLLNNNLKINKFIIFNIIYQILCVGLLFYYDNIRFDNDKKILNNTINYYSSNCKDESIVFIGNTKYKILNGEMLGNSFYNWDYDSDSLSNNRIKDFSKSLNIDYKYPTKNEIIYVISNIEKYNEAYQIDNNILIVNVSKVEY